MKLTAFLFIFFISLSVFSQEPTSNYKTKKYAVAKTITIDSVSISSGYFNIKTLNNTIIDSTYYTVDFEKAILQFKKPIATDSILINYLNYPKFLTKTYKQLDEKIIVDNTNNQQQLYKIKQSNKTNNFTPFDGLTTSGSISRGVVIGNNQNSVLNSELDLQITGKLSDKISLRASIQDANIPLQESGYSQRLDEFDQVFVELFSDNWKIRAGDVDLENKQSSFASFSKRVQGLSLGATLNHSDSKTNLFAAGAIVRGQFTSSKFIAQEGNQGPYKLRGPNGELFVLVVSGSETVYVNGIALERGENKDYIINYNAGEIIFNATFPITSEMRITVDYQFSERNYSRLVVYGGGNYDSEKLKLGISIYSENDAKNNPLQQNLSSSQVNILADAGDDTSLMTAPSATPETYSENKILYKKEMQNGIETFVFSNNPDDELFNVRFTLVGDNQGNYIISNSSAITTIFEYVAPVAGVSQGNYEPIVQLVAPNKLQLAVLNGSYAPSPKTNIGFEVAGSKNDLNLFSNIDDNNNDGFASKLSLQQAVIKKDSLWNLNAIANATFIQENFRTIERLYNAEFIRDWNIEQEETNQNVINNGNQTLFLSGIEALHHKKGLAKYQFEYLNYSKNFNGSRHLLLGDLKLNKWHILTNSSFLNAESNKNNSTFLRTYNNITYSLKKAWVGTKLALESNEQKDKATDTFTTLSQRFKSYEIFTGIGDSSKVFVQVGYKHRINDSIVGTKLKKVNSSNTYYIDSKIIQNENTNLSLYANYRTLKNVDKELENEESLNSRMQFSQKLFKQILHWNTVYETNSGTLARQEFTYVEVEPGQGVYTWIDYNENGIQELEEFEIAQFSDQGTYIRVLLPNQVFIKTHQNRLSQTLTINFQQWANNQNNFKKFLAHFYNQASYLIDRKQKREGKAFNLNPFNNDKEKRLGLQSNFRNVLFFNRGKQRYTTSYTYLTNASRNLLSVGAIESNSKSHQLLFNHKFAKNWLLNLQSNFNKNESKSENFSSKNFKIEDTQLNPKISYLLSDNARFDVFYQYSKKENTIGNLETLKQDKYGISFAFSSKQQLAVSGEFNYFSNAFTGNANSPVAYQMLEGLQPGKNYTWTLLAQKKLTKYLDLNLSYFGRKSETSKVIHTGNIQLKAYF
ncbi:MAG: hypothetical protein ACPG6B_01800 [Oceanihabitans sp.]